jgi:Uma2 family endonuclease
MTATAPTLVTPVPGKVLLNNISWQTYERLLTEMGDDRTIRLSYDRGLLEFMTPLLEHENPKRIVEKFVDVLADELNIEIFKCGFDDSESSRFSQGFRTRF